MHRVLRVRRGERSFAALFATVPTLWIASAAYGLPSYEIQVLGLTDADHTRPDGFQQSHAELLTESGYVAGFSTGYFGFGLRSTWIYDGKTTKEIGLLDGDQLPVGFYHDNYPYILTESGYAVGVTKFTNGSSNYRWAAWFYDGLRTTRIGFFDGDHTGDDGKQVTSPWFLTESGYAAGYSVRYSGTASSGQSAWLYDGTTTTRLGLFDAAHTRDDGVQLSDVEFLTEAGLAAGYSDRYSGAASSGQSTWLYDGTTSVRIGLFDADHTRGNGYQESHTTFLTSSGYAAGDSYRYNGAAGGGGSAWLHHGTTARVGLFDAEHTSGEGIQWSGVEFLTESGFAAGYSSRYSGTAYSGRSTWLDHGTTVRIGYFDADHTRDDGYQWSEVRYLWESGRATGISRRYSGTASSGTSAWLSDGTTTTRLGLLDSEHTRDDGYQSSDVYDQTQSGYVSGVSGRYSAAVSMGLSAWLYDGTSTTRIGLVDAEHTRDDGYQWSRTVRVTESGYAAGNSDRFFGASPYRESAWLYDGTTTTRVGLFDADHTGEGGIQRTVVDLLTESGFLAGRSYLYFGFDGSAGETAWIYDPSTGEIDSADFPGRSNGYWAESYVAFLSEDGLGLGGYLVFDEEDERYADYHAFAWTAEDGFVALGSLIDGGLSDAGWSYLAEAIRENGLQQIVGQGRLANGGDLAYVLRAVPEPGTGMLLLLGLVGLSSKGWRRAE